MNACAKREEEKSTAKCRAIAVFLFTNRAEGNLGVASAVGSERTVVSPLHNQRRDQ
jgi:hypothetical protein